MNTKQAQELGTKIAAHLESGETEAAYKLVAPLLRERIPFAMLDRVARAWSAVPLVRQDAFLERLVCSDTIASGPLLGTALAEQVDVDLAGAFEREREYAVIADVWYTVDAMGERAAGTALVKHFDRTLEHFVAWREDENHWVRRSIGVGVHVWAKRTRSTNELKAKRLLKFLEPLWGEADIEAVKGIGWGLKTIGRYYPDLMRAWLGKMESRPHRALMLTKATTYLKKGKA